MLEELYIDGKQVDVKDTSIVRSYKTHYFSDVESLLSDSTYTIKLPPTERNKAVMQYLHEADMNTDFPYTYHYADYIVEGMQIIRNGEVKVLGDFEIQIVYGVNRAKYLPLKETKLNELLYQSIPTIYDAEDWIVNWRKGMNLVTGKQYKYINYVSGERVSDVETDASGVIQEKLYPKEPFLSNMKEMTWHPFILSENIIEFLRQYLNEVYSVSISPLIFSGLITKLSNKGLLLNRMDGNPFSINTTITLNPLYPLDNTGYSSSVWNGASLSRWVDPKRILEDYGSVNFVSRFFVTKSFISEVYPLTIKFAFNNAKFRPNHGEIFIVKRDLNLAVVKTIEVPQTNQGTDAYGVYGVYSGTFEDTIESIEVNHTYTIEFTDPTLSPVVYSNIIADTGGSITISLDFTKSFYNVISTGQGYYDCPANLPKISCLEFIQEMLVHTCGFLGYDTNGDLKISFLDGFKSKIDTGDVYDWSGRFSNVRNSKYQFNSNAQNNWIKFNNDKDLIDRKETITVADQTIAYERDLYTFKADSPAGLENATSEYILYEQSVKRAGTTGVSFENKYVGDKWECAFVKDVNGVAKNLNITDDNYIIYQKLINRPIVKEVDVLLGFYESAQIDFTKPIYIKEWGKYCMLLELTAPNKGLCEAKLLLINQTL